MQKTMEISVTPSELHEIICGLNVNRNRIGCRSNNTARKLAELRESGEIDEGRELYLSTLLKLRDMRIETINEMIEKFESYAENN